MLRATLTAPAIFGFTGVTCGAFGAHYLRSRLSEDGTRAWNTAVTYQLLHAVAMLGIVALRQQAASEARKARLDTAFGLMLVGVIGFSGSIYGLVLGGPKLLGPVTPLGGLLMMAGWAVVGIA